MIQELFPGDIVTPNEKILTYRSLASTQLLYKADGIKMGRKYIVESATPILTNINGDEQFVHIEGTEGTSYKSIHFDLVKRGKVTKNISFDELGFTGPINILP